MGIFLAVSVLFSFLVLLIPLGTSTSIHGNFLKCLSQQSNNSIPMVPIYIPNTSTYSSILDFSIQNPRFLTSTTPKPKLIIAPLHESHVQAAVICSRKHGIQIKTRSGGHDYEGLSYTSDVPFVIVDLFNLRSINVDVGSKTAWIQTGATLGEVYYRIAEKSHILGFPAGTCPTVGVGGHLSGGGFGTLFRKYGLAADNVIDAKIVDVHGRILNKESMGEDLFWAIRGGGGGSFGVILAWKIRLVSVPPIVTVFRIDKTLKQGATALVHRWQEVAHKLPQDIYISLGLYVVNANKKEEKTIQASFSSMFLGGSEKLLTLIKERFPELGLKNKDCIEMSWIQSVLIFAGFPVDGPLDVLLNRTNPKNFYKAKSDYVKETISQIGLERIWRRLEKEPLTLILTPYGGRMSEISESEIPFPHRKGNIFKIQYLASWEGLEETEKQLSRIRRQYRYMAPYVSKSPREAYLNYRDIDLGRSKNGTASYSQAKIWGSKYFKSNFDRLVYVKSKVDPNNFFRNEQSIPAIAYI